MLLPHKGKLPVLTHLQLLKKLIHLGYFHVITQIPDHTLPHCRPLDSPLQQESLGESEIIVLDIDDKSVDSGKDANDLLDALVVIKPILRVEIIAVAV